MWFSQIIFLTLFYERYQINNLNKVVKQLDDKTYTSEELEELAYKNNICIEYIYNNDVYFFNSLNNNSTFCILQLIFNFIILFFNTTK